MKKLLSTHTKPEVFKKTSEFIAKLGFGVLSVDSSRPWGGFFVINESDTDDFVKQFFSSKDPADIKNMDIS